MGPPCRRSSASRWRSIEKSRTPNGTLLKYRASAPMSANTVVAVPTPDSSTHRPALASLSRAPHAIDWPRERKRA
jgi:hypothetical protein